MTKTAFIASDSGLISIETITYVDIDHLADNGYIDVTHGGQCSRITGFFAIEAVMMLKPSALEGRRLRWQKNVWFVHNVVAHPLMQFVALAADLVRPFSAILSKRMQKTAMNIHDLTVPVSQGFREKSLNSSRSSPEPG